MRADLLERPKECKCNKCGVEWSVALSPFQQEETRALLRLEQRFYSLRNELRDTIDILHEKNARKSSFSREDINRITSEALEVVNKLESPPPPPPPPPRIISEDVDGWGGWFKRIQKTENPGLPEYHGTTNMPPVKTPTEISLSNRINNLEWDVKELKTLNNQHVQSFANLARRISDLETKLEGPAVRTYTNEELFKDK